MKSLLKGKIRLTKIRNWSSLAASNMRLVFGTGFRIRQIFLGGPMMVHINTYGPQVFFCSMQQTSWKKVIMHGHSTRGFWKFPLSGPNFCALVWGIWLTCAKGANYVIAPSGIPNTWFSAMGWPRKLCGLNGIDLKKYEKDPKKRKGSLRKHSLISKKKVKVICGALFLNAKGLNFVEVARHAGCALYLARFYPTNESFRGIRRIVERIVVMEFPGYFKERSSGPWRVR